MKPELLLQQVRQAISEIDRHMHQGTFSQGAEGYPTSAELSVIRKELQRVEAELITTTIPEKNQRTLSIGRIVLDGWWKFDQDPLAKSLVAITDAYKRDVIL
jgi:hypothetical protein